MQAQLGELLFVEVLAKQGATGRLPRGGHGFQAQVILMRCDPWILPAAGVVAVARPAIVRRIGGHAGADRREFDVAVARRQATPGVDQRCLEAPLPQGTGASRLSGRHGGAMVFLLTFAVATER